MKELSTNTNHTSTKMEVPVVNFNSGQQQQQQQQNNRPRPSSGAPPKARTTSGNYPNQNSGPGGPGNGGYPPQSPQGMQNNHNHQGPPPPQFMQNGPAFNPAMMPGMYPVPFVPGAQNPFGHGNVVLTMPMTGMAPYYNAQQIPGQQMQQRMPQGIPMYATSPGPAGFFGPPGVMPAQFNPNQNAYGPNQSGAPPQGYATSQGSVSPNVPTGVGGPPRFPPPDVVQSTVGPSGAPPFIPRGAAAGQPPRTRWQVDSLYIPAQQAQAGAPPVVTPKPPPERKKNVLVFTDPNSGTAVDIPKKEEKPKAAAATTESNQASEPTSRQSSVSEPQSEEKKDAPEEERKRQVQKDFSLQVQARMNVEGGNRSTSISESAASDARTASKSKDAESKGQIGDSPTVVKNDTGATSSQQPQSSSAGQVRQQTGESRPNEDAAKADRSRTTSESKPSVPEVPSARNEARDTPPQPTVTSSSTESSKAPAMPSQPPQPVVDKVAEEPRRPSATATPELKSDEPVKPPVDRGLGLGAKPEFRDSRRKSVQVQDVRQVRPSQVATPPPQQQSVQENRPVENINGETETEHEMEKLEKVAGRQTYDRSALLSLENKYKQGNMMASDDLKNKVNAIIKKDGGGQGGPGGHRNDQSHGQGQGRGGGGGGYDQRGPQMPRVNSSRNFQQEEPQQRVITLNRDLNVIVSSENAWKPSYKKERVQNDSEDAEKDVILSDVRALLNKISPNNYEKLSTRMLSMPFTKTGELLVGAVDVIFDKALDEQNYAEIYAKLCRKLIDLQVPVEEGQVDENGNPAQPMKFRTVLLQRAQHYFEKTQREEEESDKDKQDTAVDPDVAEQKRVKAKRHYVGNITFISELYKFDMLTDRVILSCFQKLLPKRPDFKDADEEKMECLCKLLETCAQKIKPDQAASVKFFFDQLQKMIDLKVTSSRIRFLMQDAIDLKNNNFVPRKLNASKGLKTKEEVRQEKLKEEAQSKAETMTAIHQLPPPMPQGRPPMGPDRSRQPPPHLQPGAGLKSVRSVPGSMNMQGGAGMVGRDGRPAGQMGQPASAVKTSSVASKPNKFLSMVGQSDRAGSGGAGGAPVTLGPQRWTGGSGSLNPPPRTSMGPFGNRMDNQNRSAASSRENSMSRGEHRGSLTNTPDMRVGSPQTEPSSNQGSPQVTPAQTPRMGSPMNIPNEERHEEAPTDQGPVSDEELEDFTKHMVASFLNADEAEMQEEMSSASSQLVRLRPDQKEQFIVTVAGNLYVEAKKPDRPKYAALLLGLAKEGSLPAETLANGFGRAMALTEDIEMDVPQYKVYLVEMLAPLVVADLLPLDRLEEVFGKSTVEGDGEKYQNTFRQWLSEPDRIASDQKESLVNKDPAWAKLLQ